MHKFQSLSCFSHSYKRDLIFTKTHNVRSFSPRLFPKSITFAYFLVFPTATSAIWYSQKVPIASIPLFSQRLQARFDIHKKWQLRLFRCFSHFPAFPTMLNSYTTAICAREKPIRSTGRPKGRYFCPAGAKIWDPRHLYSNTPKWGGPGYLGGGVPEKLLAIRDRKKKVGRLSYGTFQKKFVF